jgi:NAD(P)H-dependent flavin oxidoreductase YrpB (nitropropane dioxygenase family)
VTGQRTDQPTAPSPLRTRLTDMLGVRYPIVQAGMGYVAGAGLAAATSAAGGLGIIAATTMSPQRLRHAIEEVKSRTPAPFGVNFRSDAANAKELIGLIIAERVPVASFAQAPRPDQIAALREAGVLTIASVGARRHAEKVAAWGVDAVIATGCEGGGHVGSVPTSLLIPQVAGAVDIPVIAAGGFFDGRGLVAALAYGAAGIAMGTRFLLTADSPVADIVKRAYLASDLTGTLVTAKVDGVPHRVLRTPLTERLDRSGTLAGLVRSVKAAARFRRLPGPDGSAQSWRELISQGRAMRRGSELSWAQVLMAANTPTLLSAAMVDGRPDLGLMSSGQVAGLIDDLPTCAELIERIMAEASQCLGRLGDLTG